ncbi:MAG: hypothetical protein GWN99_10290 [Gemmatimonadetes bacterium]|uniref:Polymerase/histidinol phosphatase N-terminal domain-containing protein n=1 Tax=Candidatus Kutchimonas denitrificans TaxID=3056748 RepID=A0AAE4Z812_9BACT|nr:hypothetical protein [Gemmatimonadota bacterium]NIR74683.1 hypothetical protein [Candidatus Kutchimonas denitrificans]NIS01433.1 hypothetical protein [Gemmatimonadota bacterium]NIT67174.1 hypothetical protein [Gemmatimonadota bacterium]NIU52348.1 hypothetical protein [Gemmatimonadota bacterium]
MALNFLRPRKIGRWLLLAAVAYFAVGYVSPRLHWVATERGAVELARALPIQPAGVRVSGVIHVHTHRSHDAVGDEGDVASAARRADIDFVVLSDHRAAEAPIGQWQTRAHFVDSVLIVRGQEISLGSAVGRVLAFPLDTAVSGWQAGVESFAAFLRERSGTAIVAHSRSPRSRDSWRPDSTPGIVGWEVFDLADIGRARLSDFWVVYHLAALAASAPFGRLHWSVTRLYRDGFDQPHVAAFDSLYRRAHLVALGGLDAHPKKRFRGALLPGYEAFFKSVVNHVELATPFPSDAMAATTTLANGLRSGRVFISFGDTRLARNFVLFAVASDGARYPIGRHVEWADEVYLRGGFWGGPNSRLLYRVVRDGESVAWVRGPELTWRLSSPGAYRVEAYRYTLRVGRLIWNLRPWIFANPFRVVRVGD